MRSFQRFLCLMFVLAGLQSIHAARIKLAPGKHTKLPGLGLRIRPFLGQSLIQIPHPGVTVYQNSETREKVEAFVPYELWKRDQIDALFHGDVGRIWIAEPKYLMPKKLKLIDGKHIRLKSFEAAVELQPVWTIEKIRAWVETFAGKVVETGQVRGMKLNISYERYIFEGHSRRHVQGYLLRPQGRGPVFITFTLSDSIKGKDAEAAIKAAMRSIAAIDRERIVASEQFRSKKINRKIRKSYEYEEARNRVIQSVKAMPDWWYVETRHYILKSDMTKENRDLVYRVQEDMEVLRRAYSWFFPPLRPIKEVSVITMFENREGYMAYVPEQVRWSGGLWHPNRRELIISPTNENRKRQRLEDILPIVYHEGFHQYIYYALDRTNLPTWWNEGHAMLFEASEVDHDAKRAVVKLNEMRHKHLLKFIEFGGLELDQLMLADQATFYDEVAVTRNCALSWGLIYFLRKGHPQYPARGYEDICDNILFASVESQDWAKAAGEAVKTLDMEQLEKDFCDFYGDPVKLQKAEEVLLFDKKR